MGVIEAVKKGFILSGKLKNVMVLFFILNVIMGLISLPLSRPENVGNPGIAVISFLISVVFFAIFIFLQGGALGMARDVHKTGACDISNFAVYGKRYYLRILGLLLLYILIAIGVVLIMALLGSGLLALANNPFIKTLIGVVAGVVALIIIVLLLFPIYSIVANESSIIQALKRGVQIGRDNFWITLGLFVVLILISVLISLVVGFAAGLITAPMPFTISRVIITIANSVVQSYVPIVMMLALMGFYLGICNKEIETPQQ